MNKIRVWLSLALCLVMAFFIPTKVMAAEKSEVLAQINTVRKMNGLPAFELSDSFSAMADKRAAEQLKSFSHTRPDGSEWYTIGNDVNRENIAHLNQKWQEEYLISFWMASEDHKENLMSANSKKIGIGIYQINENECYIVTLTD